MARLNYEVSAEWRRLALSGNETGGPALTFEP